jgi:hypothetical protein
MAARPASVLIPVLPERFFTGPLSLLIAPQIPDGSGSALSFALTMTYTDNSKVTVFIVNADAHRSRSQSGSANVKPHPDENEGEGLTMKLNTKILAIFLVVGSVLLITIGYYADSRLKQQRFDTIQKNYGVQLYQVDFAITGFLQEVKYDVRDLLMNDVVRTRDDGDFTQFLDANEETFVYTIGPTEQPINLDTFMAQVEQHLSEGES